VKALRLLEVTVSGTKLSDSGAKKKNVRQRDNLLYCLAGLESKKCNVLVIKQW